jgi:hypothetical protein
MAVSTADKQQTQPRRTRSAALPVLLQALGARPSRLLRVEMSAVSAAGENDKKQNDKCCE